MKFSIITSCYNQLHLLPKLKEALKKSTIQDFEWILADDGSTDGLSAVWKEYGSKYAAHEKNIGYRYGQILNKAAEQAEGDYLVFINADSYPKEDFLEELKKALTPDRIVTGIRMNTDETGRITSEDWRLSSLFYDDKDEILPINYPHPWKYMTMNSLAVYRLAFHHVGGMYEEYLGYGKEDWDFVMRAHYAGLHCYWALRAILYTQDHPAKADTPENTTLFERRVKEFSKDPRTQEKIKQIMDPVRAEAKKTLLEKRRAELDEKAHLDLEEEPDEEQ